MAEIQVTADFTSSLSRTPRPDEPPDRIQWIHSGRWHPQILPRPHQESVSSWRVEPVEPAGENISHRAGFGGAIFHSLDTRTDFLVPERLHFRRKILIRFRNLNEDSGKLQSLGRRKFEAILSDFGDRFHVGIMVCLLTIGKLRRAGGRKPEAGSREGRRPEGSTGILPVPSGVPPGARDKVPQAQSLGYEVGNATSGRSGLWKPKPYLGLLQRSLVFCGIYLGSITRWDTGWDRQDACSPRSNQLSASKGHCDTGKRKSSVGASTMVPEENTIRMASAVRLTLPVA